MIRKRELFLGVVQLDLVDSLRQADGPVTLDWLREDVGRVDHTRDDGRRCRAGNDVLLTLQRLERRQIVRRVAGGWELTLLGVCAHERAIRRGRVPGVSA